MDMEVETNVLANSLRALAMDAVQAANSGHPGMPMGMAEIAVALWTRHLAHHPANPQWPDRDRFVLSNGHGSMLQYALLHLTGYDLPMDELRRFRQLHSRTPGHPEYRVTPGVETTTGPLGQGFANAVGMALAERLLAAEFNRDGHVIVDHRTYVFVGDGCLMEGISHEAASLAGTLGLGKLVVLYDDNGISIDGEVRGWFTDDTPQRFAAYGWNVLSNVDGHDVDAVDAALTAARACTTRPTLVCCRTVIGKGAPNKEGTEGVHGAALGADEVAATRAALGWRYAPFEIPQHVYTGWDARVAGARREAAWDARFAAYAAAYPDAAAEFRRRIAGELPVGFGGSAAALVAKFNAANKSVATRKASQDVLAGLVALVPELVGGSADLTGSNLTQVDGMRALGRRGGGRYVHYGVREFGMAAVMNGIALHGGFIPYGGTFLVFSDYARNALRMAALMEIRTVFVLTHDSIGLGEDGPTHQPVEHAASLRLIPNLDVWRPCDAAETAVAWKAALERAHGPCALLLSRQSIAPILHDESSLAAMARGGYVHAEAAAPRAIVIATGSEVPLAREAQATLAAEGIAIRVVSMPAPSVFDRQDEAYRLSVLPPHLPCVAVEAGVTDGWHRYTGRGGIVIGIDRFGASAPAGEVYRELGVTAERVVEAIRRLVRTR